MKRIFLFLVFIFFSFFVFCEDIYRKTLSNGLEIFVLENNTVPLAYIEIGVRTGANSQTKDNAGLFHLYEHLLFKGNEKFKNQKEFTAAMNKLGVSSWNGSTGIDLVNYFFTVPSSKTKEGIEFWAAALKSPLFDEKELENEKSVVVSEITGNLTNPTRIFSRAFFGMLFPEEPWKLDTSGPIENIKNATTGDLKKIKEEFYTPDNTAFFIGGDVKHEKVFKFVEDCMGDWISSSGVAESSKVTSRASVTYKPTKTPFSENKKIVFPNEKVMEGMVQAIYFLRGPDGEYDEADTYAADVLGTILNSPDSFYNKIFTEKSELGIPSSDYLSSGYSTQRFSGLQSFSAAMLGDEATAFERSEKFFDVLKGEAIPALKNPANYSKKSIEASKKSMADSRTYSMETAAGYLSGLVACWSTCSADYFFDYDSNIKKVQKQDMISYIEKYIFRKAGLYAVQVNPKTFEANKDKFLTSGYEVVGFASE